METPFAQTYRHKEDHRFSRIDTCHYSPESKLMSEPRLVKPSLDAGRLKNKLVAGLASLYDPVDSSVQLESPIFKGPSMEADPRFEPDSYYLRSSLSSPSTPTADSGSKPTYDEIMDMALSETYSPPEEMDVDDDESQVSLIRPEWIGTSQFFIEQNIEWQEDGTFDSLISYRQAIVHDRILSPYDPSVYLDYSRLMNKIGFTDDGAAAANQALILIEAFLNKDPDLYKQVRKTLMAKMQPRAGVSYISNILHDEVNSLHLQAYQHLLNGLLGCACFWEGLSVAKKALQLWPKDPELIESREWLKEGFFDRHNGLKNLGADAEDLVMLTRMGKIYQKTYPWLPASLNRRTPALVKEVNKNFGAGNCEVRPVVFGTPPPSQFTTKPKKDEDVGPCGIFAIRDIKEGELIMVDQCLTAVSTMSPSKFQHCDACHATLKAPFIQPSEIIKPDCCKNVAFCSRVCYLKAMKGNSYHKVLCGKDFEWLYDATGSGVSAGAGYKWRKVMFLRIMAIVIADRNAEMKAGKKPTHPLQHPLVARMAANYASPDKLHPKILNDWQYNENIVAPTKILRMLGIDIFTETDFSQAVIQTIFWRMENNANMSTIDLHSPQPLSQNTALPSSSSNKNATHLVCLNPQYLFFNHSCAPNVSWHGAIPNPYVGIGWITGYDGQIMKVGSSAVFCRAFRDIEAGEELKISYIGDPTGAGVEESEKEKAGGRKGKRGWLEKWFEGGCGCEVCEEENLGKDRESVCAKEGSMEYDIARKLDNLI